MAKKKTTKKKTTTKTVVKTKLSLAEKMRLVRSACKGIEKGGVNNYSNYKYVEAQSVVKLVKPFLDEFKIGFDITELDLKRDHFGKNFHSVLKSKATFYNIEDPSEILSTEFYGVASDTLDKDIYKAKTSGLKYLFINTFLIPTGETLDVEVDHDGQDDSKDREKARAEVSKLLSEVSDEGAIKKVNAALSIIKDQADELNELEKLKNRIINELIKG